MNILYIKRKNHEFHMNFKQMYSCFYLFYKNKTIDNSTDILNKYIYIYNISIITIILFWIVFLCLS